MRSANPCPAGFIAVVAQDDVGVKFEGVLYSIHHQRVHYQPNRVPPVRILVTADEAAGLQTLRLLLNTPHTVTGEITAPKNRSIHDITSTNNVTVDDDDT